MRWGWQGEWELTDHTEHKGAEAQQVCMPQKLLLDLLGVGVRVEGYARQVRFLLTSATSGHLPSDER